jgi:excisionase family DNA binding protein
MRCLQGDRATNDRVGKDQSENLMDAQEYMTLLEQLERELAAWPPGDYAHLLGMLERVRVSAWVKVLGSNRDSTQTLSGQDGGRLLTVPQVAERLTIPEGYAYELARRGILPVVRLGKYVRVPLAELERWVGQQTSLERRIDRESPDFHSALAQRKRPARAFPGTRAQPGGARRERNGRMSSKSQPKTLVGFQPQPAAAGTVAEPGSVDSEGSHDEE